MVQGSAAGGSARNSLPPRRERRAGCCFPNARRAVLRRGLGSLKLVVGVGNSRIVSRSNQCRTPCGAAPAGTGAVTRCEPVAAGSAWRSRHRASSMTLRGGLVKRGGRHGAAGAVVARPRWPRLIKHAIAPPTRGSGNCGPAQCGSSSFGHSLLPSLRFARFQELDPDLHQDPSHDHGA